MTILATLPALDHCVLRRLTVHLTTSFFRVHLEQVLLNVLLPLHEGIENVKFGDSRISFMFLFPRLIEQRYLGIARYEKATAVKEKGRNISRGAAPNVTVFLDK